MKYASMTCVALIASTLMAGVAHAGTTVVTFDDLGNGLVPATYDGINWGSNWSVYGESQDPYNPESSPNRIYTNYDIFGVGQYETDTFSFATPTVFDGAYFAGVGYPVNFVLYDGVTVVATSATLDPSSTPTYLSSGYTGKVTSVGVYGDDGYYVIDNVTYTSGVPEPSTWAMMLIGLTSLGFAGYRKSRKSGAGLQAA